MKAGKGLLFLTMLMFCGLLAAEDAAAKSNSSWAREMFGPELVNTDGQKFQTEKVLKNKMVLVYSARRGNAPLTSRLIQFYNRTAKKANIEIVLLSYEKTAGDMRASMKEGSMPWYAVPFDSIADAPIRKTIHGYPLVAVFDKTGKILTRHGQWDIAIFGEKAVDAWQSENYQPKTFQDYKIYQENSWEAKLGPTLVDASGRKFRTEEVLNDKLVAVLFAQFPACQGFIPSLIQFYRQTAGEKGLEIVLVDRQARNTGEMLSCMKNLSMPWYAVPFEEIKSIGIRRESHEGLPTLAIYSSPGKLISSNGRWDVAVLGEKAVDAWRSPDYVPKTREDSRSRPISSVTERFGPELINAAGRKFKTEEVLKDRMILVYFSASWCGPCRGFTPTLVQFYRKTKKNSLAVVLVGCDRTAEDMKDYMKKYSMPWYAVPFGSPEAAALKQELHVRGIPSLAVYDNNGKLLSDSARWDVVLLGTKAVDAWLSEDYQPKTFQDYQNQSSKSRGKTSRRKRK